MDAYQVAQHGKEQKRKRQHRADPETQPHGLVLGIGFHLCESVHWLEGHAANGAAPWTPPDDLRMHRTGVTNLFFVSRAGRCARSRVLHRSMFRRRRSVVHSCKSGSSEKLLRLSGKSLRTPLRAEVVRLPSVFDFGGGLFRNNRHSADRILDLWRHG